MYSYPPTLKPNSLWMIHFDPTGDCVYASKSFIQDFGNDTTDHGRGVGQRGVVCGSADLFRGALHTDEHDYLRKLVDACKSQPGVLVNATFRLTNRQGIHCLTEWKMSLLDGAAGHPDGVVGNPNGLAGQPDGPAGHYLPAPAGNQPVIYAVGIDKVDHFLVTLAPHKLHTLTKLFFDATPVVQLCIGSGGRVLFFNQRAIQFVKSRTGTIPCMGESLQASLFAGFNDRLHHKLSEGWGGRSSRFEEKCVHPNGREDWYKIEVMPFIWQGERGVSISLINVTTTREAQRRAGAIEEQIHNSTYTISHHLRAHLSNVVGISVMMEDLLMENRGNGELPTLVEMMKEEAGRLEKAVRRIEEYLFSGD